MYRNFLFLCRTIFSYLTIFVTDSFTDSQINWLMHVRVIFPFFHGPSTLMHCTLTYLILDYRNLPLNIFTKSFYYKILKKITNGFWCEVILICNRNISLLNTFFFGRGEYFVFLMLFAKRSLKPTFFSILWNQF